MHTDELIRHVSKVPLYPQMVLPNKIPIKLQIDSGATGNVILLQHVDNITTSSVKLKMYNASLRGLWASAYFSKALLMETNTVWSLFQVVQEDFMHLLSKPAYPGFLFGGGWGPPDLADTTQPCISRAHVWSCRGKLGGLWALQQSAESCVEPQSEKIAIFLGEITFGGGFL